MSDEEATRYLAFVLIALLGGVIFAGVLPMVSVGNAGNASDGHHREMTETRCETESGTPSLAVINSLRSRPPTDSGMTTAMADIATMGLHYDVRIRVVGRNTTRYQDTFTASTDATLSLFQFLADPGLDTALFESFDPVTVDIHREAAEGSTRFSRPPKPELELSADASRDGGALLLTFDGPKGMRAVVWNSLIIRRGC